MSALTPFRQSGPTVALIAVTTQQEVAQALSQDAVGNQQYVITNTGNNPAWVAMGANANQALSNAVVPTIQNSGTNTYPLLNGSQITITGPQNAFFSAVTQVSNAPIWITPGYGQ